MIIVRKNSYAEAQKALKEEKTDLVIVPRDRALVGFASCHVLAVSQEVAEKIYNAIDCLWAGECKGFPCLYVRQVNEFEALKLIEGCGF